jgi:hypothetical protein
MVSKASKGAYVHQADWTTCQKIHSSTVNDRGLTSSLESPDYYEEGDFL